MNISDAGLKLIMDSEGLRLKAYQDSVGVWTIGYGHTKGVAEGLEINEADARDLLLEDVKSSEDCVTDNVQVALTQGQYDALVSFVFNLGCGAFHGSTLLHELNAGNYKAAAEQFGRWVHAGSEVLPGLVTRRANEKALFLS